MNTISIEFRQLTVAAAVLVMGLLFTYSTAQAQSAAALYQQHGPAPSSELPPQAQAAPGMAVRTNVHALQAARISFELPGIGQRVADRQRHIERDDGSLTWVGEMPGHRGSVVSITSRSGVLAGFINDGRNLFEIMPGKAGGHVVFQLDVAALPVDGDPLVPELADTYAASETSWEPPMAEAEAIVQDLMVVYTPASAAAYAGSGSGIEARIISAVEMANQAYTNSALGLQLNLVYLGEVAYTETGNMNEALTSLRATADGQLDEVHSLRDAYGADLVSLISEDDNYCGLGYRMSSNSASFESWAFNVVYSACLPNQTLAHELGHNQGNTHDRDSTSSTPYYPYAFGHRRCVMDGYGFITVMSYVCAGATRVAHFSNPDVTYNGFVTGIDHDVDPANSADTVRAMSNMAPTIAAFRTSTSGTPPVAPNALQIGGQTQTSVSMSWNDNAADEDGYRVERSTEGGSFTEIASLPVNSQSFEDSGLTSATHYSYRVRAYNGSGYSAYSNSVATTTDGSSGGESFDHQAQSDSPGVGTVQGTYTDTWYEDGAEQGITEVETGGKPAKRSSQVRHEWIFDIPAAAAVSLHMQARASGDLGEDSFRISYSQDGNSYSSLFVVNSAMAQTYVAELPASLSGQVRIRAEDTDRGQGNRSLETLHVDWLVIRTEGEATTPPPPGPGEISLQANGYKQKGVQHVSLSWTDAPAGASMLIMRNGQQVGTAGSSASGDGSYNDVIGNKGGGTYFYQVCTASNPGQCSNAVTVSF